jgi:hypothetical protein
MDQAGIHKDSGVTNGDDALLIARERKLEGYHAHLESLGLKINRSKSFRSPEITGRGQTIRGVFCERLATGTTYMREPKDTDYLLVADKHRIGVPKKVKTGLYWFHRGVQELKKYLMSAGPEEAATMEEELSKRLLCVEVRTTLESRLAEAAGTERLERMDGYNAVDVLNDMPRGTHPEIRRLAKRTATRMALGSGGPMCLGGGGCGEVTVNTVKHMITTGAYVPRMKTPTKRESEDSRLTGNISCRLMKVAISETEIKEEDDDNYVQLHEVIDDLTIGLGMQRIVDGEYNKNKIRTKKEHRRQLAERGAKMRKDKRSPIELTRSVEATTRYSAKALQKCRHYLRRKQFRRACRTLKNDDPWVARAYLKERARGLSITNYADSAFRMECSERT